MKKVNLFGCTTAEKLILLEEAYDEVLQSLLANATPKGEYQSDIAYTYGDMVNYNNGSYIYYNENNSENIAPTNIDYWFMIAGGGPTGKQGRGVFAGIFADNTITVYVENADTPRNGDLIEITSAAGHDEQLGNLYIVVTENGSTTLPIQNVAPTGNIRGAQGQKGDPGNSTYCHYITFDHIYSVGRGRAALILVNHSSTPFSTPLDLCEAINTFPSTAYIPITIEAKATGGTGGSSGNRAAFIKSEGNGMPSGIRISTGYGIDMPPADETITSAQIQNLYDYVL